MSSSGHCHVMSLMMSGGHEPSLAAYLKRPGLVAAPAPAAHELVHVQQAPRHHARQHDSAPHQAHHQLGGQWHCEAAV